VPEIGGIVHLGRHQAKHRGFHRSSKDRLRITAFIAKFSPSMTPSSYLRRGSKLLLSGQTRTAGQITSGEEDKNNAT
jgi:hypothetical protein